MAAKGSGVCVSSGDRGCVFAQRLTCVRTLLYTAAWCADTHAGRSALTTVPDTRSGEGGRNADDRDATRPRRT
eukprot:617544-Prymnesium_polylepis.1